MMAFRLSITAVGLLMLHGIVTVFGQDDFKWVKHMHDLVINETIGQNVVVYQLEATYRGSSAGIEYGFNSKLSDAKDNSLDPLGNRFMIYQNGTVETINAEFDYETLENRKIIVQLIARLEADHSKFIKRASTILVKNENDEWPKFLNDSLEADYEEDKEIPPNGLKIKENIFVVDPDGIIDNGLFFLDAFVKWCQVTTLGLYNCRHQFALRRTAFNTRSFAGDLYLLEKLDYERGTPITVQVQATDGLHTVNSDVVVNVLDIQDSRPEWTLLNGRLSHLDGTPAGTVLGQVVANDTDTLNVREIYYVLLDGFVDGYEVGDYFEVDARSGIIKNKVPLDLESKPFRDYDKNIVNSNWPLNIRACEIIEEDPVLVIGTSDVTECILGLTRVDITDINDNAPLMNAPTYVYFLREDAQRGEYLTDPTISILDLDTELYNTFTVKFENPSREFSVIGSSRNPTIRVDRPELLDYENGPRSYTLKLIATDSDRLHPEHWNAATVTINILDVNDNVPSFYPPGTTEYEANIYEDANGGDNVIRIQATDIDSSLFGTDGIRYKLQGFSGHTKLFHIDEESGQVTVANCPTPGVAPCLDHDTKPNVYTLTVVATDTYGNTAAGGRSAGAELTINILDRNDNPPIIVQDYVRYIEEGQIQTRPDLFIEATDVDNGGNVQFEFSIISQPEGNFWQLENVNNMGHVTATREIAFRDAPNEGKFELEVLVTDGVKTDIGHVTIIVQDMNDHKPIVIPQYIELSIPETTLGGAFITNVTSEDADDPTSPNGQIFLQIRRGSLGKFRIESNDDGSGQIYTTDDATFDVEANDRYNITLQASDRGTPAQVGFATVIINILDANNKRPAFKPDSQRFSVFDNEVPGSRTVYTLKANDPDDDAILEFDFIEPIEAYLDGSSVSRVLYDYTDLFRLNRTTGGVLVNKQLDSDRVNRIVYQVRVTDVTPIESQTGIGTLTIIIKDYNTRRPIFHDIAPVTIDEEPPAGSYIMSVIATDPDGRIKLYRIKSQGDDLFEIGSNSGVVQFKSDKRRLDYDDERRTNSSYIIVEVADTGIPTLYAEKRFDIFIRNINDNYPKFTSSAGSDQETYYSSIPENSPDGTPVVRVYAKDGDRPDELGYASIRFSLVDDRFDIDNETGEVFVRLRNGAELDREKTPEISVAVTAYDTPDGPESVRKKRVATIAIQLLDVNDNPSEFSKAVYYVTIYETISKDTDILQLFTSDDDSGNYAIPFFYKVPGVGNDTTNFFGVREQTGHIYVKRSLINHVDNYHFQVMARDDLGQGPRDLIRTATVYVTVNDSHNEPPYWRIPAYDNMTITVLEEQYLGMFVFDVKADDRDSGTNGLIDYSFVDEGKEKQSTGAFTINSVTGVISADMVYDRETVPRYVLLLKAKDNGATPLETTRFLTVVILDVNDNKPTFTLNEIEFRVPENADRGYHIGNIEATDLDLDPVILYEIISGNEDGVFELTTTSTGGLLTLARELDRETRDIYHLDILAKNEDHDYTVVRNRRAIDPSIITVKILVGDINDLAPVFLQDSYYGCVSTRSSLQTNILTVQAIDRDAVGTGIVRYTITDGNVVATDGDVASNVTLFDISEKFGFVTNQVLMRDYVDRIFKLTVNARDGEHIATSESSETEATIFITQPGKEAKLLITQNTVEVRLYKTQIQRIIEQAEDIDLVCITDIQDHVVDSAGSVTTLWSDMYISAMKGDRILSATELVNIVNRDRLSKRKSEFELLYIREVEAASSSEELDIDDSTVLVVLVIIAILIFLVIIFCILAYMCIRAAKQHKKQKLIQKSYATPGPLPSPEPMVVQPIVEPIVYDNRTFVPDQQDSVSYPAHHVEYAVVQKGEPALEMEEQTVDDTQIIVEVPRDSPVPVADVFQPREPEEEYRIVTEPM